MVPLDVQTPPFIVARRAYRLVNDAQGMAQFMVAPRVSNPDRPGGALRVRASKKKIAAGVNAEIPERLELPPGRVDSQALSHCAKVEQQRTAQGDGSPLGIEQHIAIAHVALGCDAGTDNLSGAKLAIEADRKSTRLNSSHLGISYAVFCL